MRTYIILQDGSMTTINQSITDLEIVVVCLSYISAMFSVLVGLNGAGNPRNPLTGAFYKLVLIFASIAISLTAIILAITEAISLDAMAAATIGLIPSLHLLRSTRLQELKIRWFVFQRVYGGTEGIFFYYRIRTEKPGPARHRDPTERLHIIFYPRQVPIFRFVQYCQRTFTLCCRRLPETEKDLSRFHREAAKRSEEKNEKDFWTGYAVEKYENGLVLTQNHQYGGAWFEIERVLGGHHLVTDPSKVHAGTSRSVIHGLCALTEIIIVGDLCRHFFKPKLDKDYDLLIPFDRYRAAMSFCMQTLCNLDLLEQWGIRQGSHDTSALSQEQSNMLNRENIAKERYVGFKNLFFLLTVKSRKFRERNETGRKLVAQLLRDGANGESMHTLRQGIKNWLSSYNYDIEVSSSNTSPSSKGSDSELKNPSCKNFCEPFSCRYLTRTLS